MKKVITLAAFVFASVAGFAQMKPQAGDCSIGIDATPFLTYVGGMFSNAGATAPTFGGQAATPLSISMKHMRTDDMAMVTRVGVGLVTGSTDNVGGGETKTSGFNLDIFAGLEKRRGEGRVVGVASAGVLINRAATANTESDDGAGTVTTSEGGDAFTAGAGMRIGVEYFVAPMISLEGAFNAGIGFTSTSERTTTVTGGAANIDAPASSGFGIVTVPTAQLGLNFWFR